MCGGESQCSRNENIYCNSFYQYTFSASPSQSAHFFLFERLWLVINSLDFANCCFEIKTGYDTCFLGASTAFTLIVGTMQFVARFGSSYKFSYSVNRREISWCASPPSPSSSFKPVMCCDWPCPKCLSQKVNSEYCVAFLNMPFDGNSTWKRGCVVSKVVGKAGSGSFNAKSGMLRLS